jgi:hypothetical protein
MKKLIAWPLAWACYWLGHAVSRPLAWWDMWQWVHDALYVPYTFFMMRSVAFQGWAGGDGSRWPWLPWGQIK